MKSWAVIFAILVTAPLAAQEQPPESMPYRMELPVEIRAWFRNPDGSCVQCSGGLCGIWQNEPTAYTLLWDSEYGPKVRGGSGPSRVEAYAERRKIPIFNVTGSGTWDWMRWAARTRRMAAIGAGRSHFQTLYGWDPSIDRWAVLNNNSTSKVDTYTWEEFRRLHLSSGEWCWVIDRPPPAPVPQYATWWQ